MNWRNDDGLVDWRDLSETEWEEDEERDWAEEQDGGGSGPGLA